MSQRRNEIRAGDIEPIARKLNKKGRPMKGRMLVDKEGRKIYYNTDKRGQVEITHYEGDRDD